VIEPRVIYRDENFLALKKPAGLLVHAGGGVKSKEKTLADWLKENYPQTGKVGDDPVFRPGIVHRLDKDTSGLMLVALNQDYFSYLKSLFQSRQIKKTYLALVHGSVKEKEGLIEKTIGLKSGSIKRTTRLDSAKNLKPAVTYYRLQKRFSLGGEKFSLLAVAPQTGRTHQIRVHLASIGHPVVGDKLYGGKRDSLGLERQFLHASTLEFPVEPGKVMKIAADLPGDLENTLRKLTPEN